MWWSGLSAFCDPNQLLCLDRCRQLCLPWAFSFCLVTSHSYVALRRSSPVVSHPPSLLFTLPSLLSHFPTSPFSHPPFSPSRHLQNFFPDLGSSAKDVDPKKKAERAKKIMMQEYFSESGRVPEVEGVLYMKEGLKKPWKKYFFMLRASGLYHSTKGRSKVS